MTTFPVVEFVDRIGHDAIVRLNLNDDHGWFTGAEGFSLGIPILGGEAGAYGREYEYRQLTAQLYLAEGASLEDYLARLSVELVRPRNLLRFIRDEVSEPLYFHTYASPLASVQWDEAPYQYGIEVTIDADPWATGERVDAIVNGAVPFNPATAGGLFLDTPTIRGDVAAPAVIWLDAPTGTGQVLLATEPDPPGSTIYFKQAELGTSIVAPASVAVANDPLMSGTGNNYIRYNPAVNSTTPTPVFLVTMPAGMPAGDYRVLVRAYRAQGSTFRLQAGMVVQGATSALDLLGPVVVDSVPARGVTEGDIDLIDLGVLPFPPRVATAQVGFSPIPTPQPARVRIYAARATGATRIDFDYVLLVPANDSTVVAKPDAPVGVAGARWVLDGVAMADYFVDATSPFDAAAHVVPGDLPALPRGGPIMLTPGVKNRLHIVAHYISAISSSQSVSVSYWPRWMHLRPVGG